MSLDNYIFKIKSDEEKVNDVIIKYRPYIINTIVNKTGRYIEVENDDILSIGLLAFNEAITKYEKEKGHFLSFAKLVVESRIINYLKKESHKKEISYDEMLEKGIEFGNVEFNESENNIRVEILRLNEEIQKFGFNFNDLVYESPKHIDTRKKAIGISEKVSKDRELINFMYTKFRLPITLISNRYKTTIKVIKRSKKFIIATTIIYYKNLKHIIKWIS